MTTPLGPLSTPLPPLPDDVFTSAQWSILLALMDTVVPRIVRASAASPSRAIDELVISEAEYGAIARATGNDEGETLDAYLAERPSESEEFKGLLRRQLVSYAREDQRRPLMLILSILSTRPGALLLTGYATPLDQLDIKSRTAILQGWGTHYIGAIRTLYNTLTSIGKMIHIKSSRLFPTITGFSAIPLQYSPGPSYEYTFLQFPESQSPAILDFDVVIVGSGLGGGISAKNLAEAGFSVLVVDKAYHYPSTQLPMTEAQGMIHLFENGGVIPSEDSSINVLTGSNFGGGGTVNWSAALQPQGFVRKEWAEDRHLPLFASATFQDALDRVCERMGVSDKHIRHNHGNRVLLEGARRMGHSAKAVPQNTAGKEHYCGHCIMGCASCEKQGSSVCWLPDAARAGAQFIEGLSVEKVLMNGKKAVGVKGLWTSRAGGKREVIVKAKRVIVSAGSIYSPHLLMNSGIKNNQIGRHLYLHPVNVVSAFFKEEVRPWEGGILTTVCSSFENLDGHGHGVKLEATCMLPSLCLSMINWNSGTTWKTTAAKYPHMNSYISLTRDRDPGRVLHGPKIEYTPSAFDRRHVLTGLIEMSRMLLVAGAREIHVNVPGIRPFIVDETGGDATCEIVDPRFVEWIAHVEAVGNSPPNATFACAHQMGSNRMSATKADGVVDQEGRVWGTKGLYVADASVFPSASGVNPMVTNLAISDVTSRGIAAGLKKETGTKL
ncbi:hypothetical protein ACLOAV_001180 [Pseudogymnoascus australis]